MIDVVFMGSPAFAVPALKSAAEQFNVTGVVTQPDRPAGRGRSLTQSPVKTAALALGIPVIQPEKLLHNTEAILQIREWNPAVIIVAAYGKILRKELLEIPQLGCVNIHASLLPRWRGASPIQAAILHGDEKTGITLMRMDEGLDTGPILSQSSIEIKPEDTAGSLETRLSVLGSELMLETLPGYLSGFIKPVPQPSEGETYAPLLKKEDGRLDFSQPSDSLERQVRAFNPWPGCFTMLDGSPFKVHKAFAVNERGAKPGKMSVIDGYPAVGTGSGLLVLSEVQPPGKKSRDGKQFLMGYRRWDHEVG